MKSFLKYALIAAILMSSTSCEEFLKEDPKGRMMSDNTFRHRDDLYGSLHALYKQVTRVFTGGIPFSWMAMGDDITTHPAMNKAVIREFDVMTVSDENAHFTIATGFWTWVWRVIKGSNFIINCPNEIPGATAADIDFVRGQAHYWRAWSYFNLVRLWGPVPIMTELAAEMGSMKLSTIAEVYEFLVADLIEAERLLPTNHAGTPWAVNGINVLVNKGAAQATLAQVYLTMGGWPLNYGAEYYAMAAREALKVIDGAASGTYYYELYDCFSKVHSNAENHRNREVVLGVYYNATNDSQQNDDQYVTRSTVIDIPQVAGGFNDYGAEIRFYLDFPEGTRKDWTYAPVITLPSPNVSAGTNGVTHAWWSTTIPVSNRRPYNRKSAWVAFGTDLRDTREYDHYVSYNLQSGGWGIQTRQAIRLAEVYLWYAEAVGRANLTDQFPRAIGLLNEVRNRANGDAVAARNIYPASLTGEQLAKAAWDEHGWEIALWWGGALAPRYTDQLRMHGVPGYHCPMMHYNQRRADYANQTTHLVPESERVLLHRDTGAVLWDGQAVRIGEGFGPTEPWRQEKLFLPYPKRDADQIPALRDVDKFSMIK